MVTIGLHLQKVERIIVPHPHPGVTSGVTDGKFPIFLLLLEARGYRSPPIAKLLVVNTHEVPFSATFGFVKSKIGLYTPRQLMEALRLDEIAGVTGDNVPGFHGQS